VMQIWQFEHSKGNSSVVYACCSVSHLFCDDDYPGVGTLMMLFTQ